MYTCGKVITLGIKQDMSKNSANEKNVGPGLYPNCLKMMVFLIFFFKKKVDSKKTADDKKHAKITNRHGKFFMIFLLSADCFQNQLFLRILSGILSK